MTYRQTKDQELLIQANLLAHHTVKVTLKYLVRQMQAHICVAMSLSPLVYNFRNPITSSADLVKIMNIGNNVYSALSQSCKKGHLLLTDLPVMVNLSDINYQLTCGESYSGLKNCTRPIIANFPYFISLLAAFNSLLMDNYTVIIMHLF